MFVDRGISLEEEIENNIRRAEKLGTSREGGTILTHSTLPTLKRWKGLKPCGIK